MDFDMFREEAVKLSRAGRESNPLYKRYFIGLDDMEGQPALHEEKVGDGKIESLPLENFEIVISDGNLVHNGTAYASEREIERMGGDFYDVMHSMAKGSRAAAMISATAMKVIEIVIPDGEKSCLRVLFEGESERSSAIVIFNLGRKSAVEIFESHRQRGRGVGGIMQRFIAGEGAGCEVNIARESGDAAGAISLIDCQIGNGGKVDLNIVHTGGSKSISRNTIRAVGKGAKASVNEIVIGEGSEKFDIYTYMENVGEGTACTADGRAVLSAGSRCYLKGFAMVSKGATESKSHISERGILVGNGSHVDIIPEMSINDGNVDATHYGLSMPISEEALFYTMSRGLKDNEAGRLVAEGQLAGLVDRIKNRESRENINRLVAEKIGSAMRDWSKTKG